MSGTRAPLPMRIKLANGFGSVAFGVKDTGFSFFLLIYYNQVLGMDAALVSTALLIALLVDAVVDPIIGNLTDRTYTRWGRRLPWLYVAPIPLAFAWVALWSPPWSSTPSFEGLLGIAITVRVLLSACEVPSVSLVPEITADYDERTTVFRFRYLSGWSGGILMMALAYSVFMPGSEGLLRQEGYVLFGTFGAILMVISVIGSALGQHSFVARLPDRKPDPFSFRSAFSEIKEAFSERAFVIFALGGLAAYVSQGMTFSLTNYLNVFIWQFSSFALAAYPWMLFASVVLMFFIVSPMHRTFGKPKSAAIGALAALALFLVPYGLVVLGLWPQVGGAMSTSLYFGFHLLANTFGIVVMISASSMIAEIVEAHLEKTGRRAEGAFYSGNWLVQKCATGLGIFLSGQIIAASQLPERAVPGAVDQDVLNHIIILYSAATIGLSLFAAFWLGRFPIGRAEHEARVAALVEASSTEVRPGGLAR